MCGFVSSGSCQERTVFQYLHEDHSSTPAERDDVSRYQFATSTLPTPKKSNPSLPRLRRCGLPSLLSWPQQQVASRYVLEHGHLQTLDVAARLTRGNHLLLQRTQRRPSVHDFTIGQPPKSSPFLAGTQHTGPTMQTCKCTLERPPLHASKISRTTVAASIL